VFDSSPANLSPEETDALIAAIDHVKILDPACGSGAFPMGALHRLVDLLTKLDPNNHRWEQKQLERAQYDRLLAEQMQDDENRENALHDVEAWIRDIEHSFNTQYHALDFARKLYLIENCIFGVDIQPIACQIAKLRFFITLIVDQKVDRKAENFGVRPLPNLETKIVVADTLTPIELARAAPIRPLRQPDQNAAGKAGACSARLLLCANA
jgi:adenine-specific DNA-methyltransferase